MLLTLGRTYPRANRLLLAHLLRGTAAAQSGARVRWVSLGELRGLTGSHKSVLECALSALEGEIALAEGDLPRARKAFDSASLNPKVFRLSNQLFPMLVNELPGRDGAARVMKAQGDPRGAIAAYRALNTPGLDNPWVSGKFEPRYVLDTARLLQAKGDRAAARAEYRRFLDLWRDADPDLPEIEEARRFVDKSDPCALSPPTASRSRSTDPVHPRCSRPRDDQWPRRARERCSSAWPRPGSTGRTSCSGRGTTLPPREHRHPRPRGGRRDRGPRRGRDPLGPWATRSAPSCPAGAMPSTARAGPAVPAHPPGPHAGAGGGPARDLLHGLDQRLRARAAGSRARRSSSTAARAASARPRSSSVGSSAPRLGHGGHRREVRGVQATGRASAPVDYRRRGLRRGGEGRGPTAAAST